jgi:DnaJ-class molecular chaperone
MITAENITDEQIRELRDGEQGLLDATLRDLCRVALQDGEPTEKYPVCQICGWRKGGTDQWDRGACECGLRAMPYFRCSTCAGLGTVPYNIGSQPCGSCDGSGLIDPGLAWLARARCAEILNQRAKDGAK